jgi:hypothetical protein
MIFIKSLVVWFMFILAESLNGTVRILWLVPSLGVMQAERLSFAIGALLVLAIATLFSPWLRATETAQLLSIGGLWLVLTVGFELVLGHFILGNSWEQIAAHYNLFTGGLMPLGLVWLILAPLIATKLRRMRPHHNQRTESIT